MTGITDDFMRTMLSRSAPYSVVILERGPAYGSSGADAVIWEHGRRNFALRAAGQLAVVCPIPDDTNVCGVGIFTPPPDEVTRLMEEDPAVQAGVLTFTVHPCRAGRSPGTACRARPTSRRPSAGALVGQATSVRASARYSRTAGAGTRKDRPTRTADSSPPCTRRYTVIFETRMIAATSATVRKATAARGAGTWVGRPSGMAAG
jgi:hypothetical protein